VIGSYTIPMASQVYVGLAVTSHAAGTLSTAVLDNLTFSSAAGTTAVVTPRSAALTSSQSQQFTVSMPGGGAVNWNVDGIAGGNGNVGTISASGFYVPPAAPGTHTITALSATNALQFATATVAITDLAGVYTYHVDAARTGQNVQEYALTPASVSGGTFGKRWSCPLNGDVYAQPLYVANLAIGGGVHNVLFVATMHDSVYAFDADDPRCITYWQVNFLGTGVTPIPASDTACGDILTEIGITGTPVIDPVSQTLYLVAATKENGSYFQRLHALSLATGSDQATPMPIQASVAKTAGGAATFSPLLQNQRSGLVFANGGVYIAWAAHCDVGPYWGWLMRYDATSLAQTAVLNTTPDGTEGGIWMSGGAPAVDATGSLYFSTGNGTFDDTASVLPPLAPRRDFGMSFLKVDPTSLAVQDFYTPSQEATWSASDADISSSGIAVLPDGAGPVFHPKVLIGGDKRGHLWMIDRTQMQRFSSSSDNVVQFLTLPNPGNCSDCDYTTPSFWNNTVYLSITAGPLMALPLTNGLIPATAQNVVVPASQSHETYLYPGATAMISASPAGNGIAWVLDNHTNGTGDLSTTTRSPAVLRAYDATNLGLTLYSSSVLAADSAGAAVKFTLPVVANGHVYVTGGSQLTVYGLVP
jgi:hypothetical protein